MRETAMRVINLERVVYNNIKYIMLSDHNPLFRYIISYEIIR